MAPSKKKTYKNEQELNSAYLDAADKIAVQNGNHINAQNALISVFVSGINYTDPTTGEKKVSDPMDEEESKTERYKLVYGEGEKTIKEVTRSDTTPELISWFCRIKGFSAQDFVELGNHPDSERSRTLLQMAEGMKQDFHDLMTSNDPEKLSDFYISVFRQFEKELPLVVNSGDLDSLVKNWPLIRTWCGVTGAIQQSLENGDPAIQTAVIEKLDSKVAKTFGQGTSLSSVLGTMQVLNKAATTFYSNLKNPEEWQKIKNTEGAKNAVSDIHSALRGFKALEIAARKQGPNGLDSPKLNAALGNAGILGTWAYLDRDFLLQARPEVELIERKFLAGDPSGVHFFETEHLNDIVLNASTDVRISTSLSEEYGASLLPYDEGHDLFDEENIKEILDAKGRSGEVLNGLELASFLMNATPKQKEQVDSFQNSSPAAQDLMRFSHLKPDVQQAIRAIALRDYGTEPQEVLSGEYNARRLSHGMASAHNRDVREGKTRNLVNGTNQKTLLSSMMASLTAVKVTSGSSSEFKQLDTAFKRLEAMTAAEIEAEPKEYKKRLEKLSQAADTYIKAKKKDGKKDRSTDKGQKRFNLAKRMKAFADTTLAEMENTRELLNQPRAEMILSEHPEMKLDGKVSKRIDDFFAPGAKGSEECAEQGIYDPKTYNSPEVQYPEKHPFSNHELALIGLAGMAEGENLTDTSSYIPSLTPDENGVFLFTHNVVDVLFHFRENGRAQEAVDRFAQVRQSGADAVRAYMYGNTQPLAKRIGQAIKGVNYNAMNVDSLTEDTYNVIAYGQEMMNLMRSHPELLADSGLSAQDVEQFRSLEKYAELSKNGLEAAQKLQNETELTKDEKLDLAATVLAVKLIESEREHAANRALSKGQGETLQKQYFSVSAKKADALQNLRKTEKEYGNDSRQAEEAREGYLKADRNNDGALFRLGQYLNPKKSSKLLNKLTESADFNKQIKSMTGLIKNSEAFRDAMQLNGAEERLQDQTFVFNLSNSILDELKSSVRKVQNEPVYEAEQNIRIDVQNPTQPNLLQNL